MTDKELLWHYRVHALSFIPRIPFSDGLRSLHFWRQYRVLLQPRPKRSAHTLQMAIPVLLLMFLWVYSDSSRRREHPLRSPRIEMGQPTTRLPRARQLRLDFWELSTNRSDLGWATTSTSATAGSANSTRKECTSRTQRHRQTQFPVSAMGRSAKTCMNSLALTSFRDRGRDTSIRSFS